MLKITSKQNAQLKHWRKLATTKGRKQSGQYMIEGIHLIEEALQSGAKIKYLIYSEHYLAKNEPFKMKHSAEEVLLADNCLAELSQTETTQGIFAIIEMGSKPTAITKEFKRILLVDAVQDPGNLGTLIRTADAANYDAIILGTGTVDVYNDKVIRSTQGSLWHLPIIQADLNEWIPQAQQQGTTVLATALHQSAIDYRQFELKEANALAILVGNEGQGVNQSLIELADQSIYIPMPGQAESLNVGVAGAILMFKFVNE
ncbi:TrmH family RNA methyltransferase [Globicatella sanguinis]|uniref:TrmH family RNA methyltransferase n=1 Tax=Globicatella sanguinis TaxID=13076 RepID=UPI000826BD16|nr:RNA methyltransferase [Globicatella sanguinis]